jgi:signal transduction histidine kinase
MLLDLVDCGIVFLDDMGTLVSINLQAERILQVSRRHIIGKRVDMLPLRTSAYRVLSENSRAAAVEMSIEGKVISVRSTVVEGSGDFSGELFELRDITSEKQEKHRWDEFAAMMTHDLKSPLAVIMGYLQLLITAMPLQGNRSLHMFIKEMEKSAEKMLTMIDDVLDSYRLEVGQRRIDMAPCNIRMLLEGCCRDGEHEANVYGSTFSSDISADIPALDLDAKQLGRVFANLIGNAVKFTPRGGAINVCCAMRDGALLVEVNDTGIGIPPDELPRVFGKYFRATSAQGFKGSGLGLTISKEIVEAHGGHIGVESVSGKGTRVAVTLPVDRSRLP